MFSIQFMDPYLFWVGVPLVLGLGIALAWYSTKLIEGARRFYGDLALLDLFSPANSTQTRSIWAQWIAVFLLILTAAAGPNMNDTPTLAEAGSLQVQIVVDVSPSAGAEDYRRFLPVPPGHPGANPMYQFGTRLDMMKRIVEQDILPQLKHNEVGLITVQGSGYNMWDLTRDQEALKYMLRKFVKVGAAPGGGADFSVGLAEALAGFKNIEGKGKERFIVLFTDGGFTGDREALDKVLAEIEKEKIHLLIIGLGGSQEITVPKYNSSTRQRDGAYEGTTKWEPEIAEYMLSKLSRATLLTAPPGTERVVYDFPAKAGGVYATPKQANLYPWLLAAALLLVLNITFGGGGLPRWKLAGSIILAPVTWVREKLAGKRS